MTSHRTMAGCLAIWTLYAVLVVLGTPPVWLKALLMPSLLLWVWVALGPVRGTPEAMRLAWPLLAGLALATVGDVALESDRTFLVGMAGFLGMQVAYLVGFRRLGALPWLRGHPVVPVGYAGVWLAANLVLGPRLGDLAVPVAVYSAALSAMAAVAAGVSARVGLGGLLFLVSDTLIGAGIAGLDPPGRDLVVIVTYLAAQYLIATGWVSQLLPAQTSTGDSRPVATS